ncbi:cupin domain-containing protein [Geminicoccus roseus]|uniref:cupin domain-containing protein n=1 Tax=Geminicoccus roseus TaxID=404900 RepID=UPI000483BF3A|nr:cupin domain-containing protein [Geminicoccus roseus]
MKKFLCSLVLAALPLQVASADSQQHPHGSGGVKVTLVYEHQLPGMPNKSIKGVLVEYEPGGVNPAHTHARSALIYATVLEGAVLNQLNGGPIRTFTKGQNFTELPGDRHDVSANASETEPAKLLAVFVVDTDDTVLTTPIER